MSGIGFLLFVCESCLVVAWCQDEHGQDARRLLVAGDVTTTYIVSTMANDAFKALAHPIRRDIVERLSGGAATVGEASRDLGVSKPTISRHLKLLEEAGVVTRVIDGRTHRLALKPETLAETSDWIDIQRARWERLFDVVGEFLEERKE
jgi:DNA-binding transcriptional ArsR family regulator